MPASAACTTGGAASSATRIRRAVSRASPSSARRVRRQRRHRRPGLPLAGLQRQQHRFLQLEGATSRTSRAVAQHEGRLPGHLDDRQPGVDDQRHESRLPRQQRRSEPAPMSLSPFQNDGRAGWHAGFVQEQFTHGKLTLQGALRFRSRRQLVPRTDAGSVEVLPEQDRLPGDEGRGQLQRLHAAPGRRVRRVRQRHGRR